MRKLPVSLLIILCLSVPAFTAESGEYIGALTRESKAIEDERPYLTQCELGSIAADAVRETTQADIALVPTADLTGRLPEGLLTHADIDSVLRKDELIVCLEVTPSKLYALLESAVSHIELDTATERVAAGSEVFDGFCQVSGFSFLYDVSAPTGERVFEITEANGNSLLRTDETSRLILATTISVADGSQTGAELSDAMSSYLASHNSIPADSSNRIGMIGARDLVSTGLLSPGTLVGGALVLALLLILWRRRYAKYKDEYGNTK